jgi:hypothetical protein
VLRLMPNMEVSSTDDADDAHFITSFVYSGARGRQPGTVTSTTKLVLSHKHPDDYKYVRSPVSRWFVRSDPAVVDYRIDHTHGLVVESLSGDPHIDDDVAIGPRCRTNDGAGCSALALGPVCYGWASKASSMPSMNVATATNILSKYDSASRPSLYRNSSHVPILLLVGSSGKGKFTVWFAPTE